MIDVLTSATLKHLREDWWNETFTDFLMAALAPRPGTRILNIGCGTGTAEVRMGRRHLSQLRLVSIDIRVDRVAAAARQAAGHNQRLACAAGSAAALPFGNASFDSVYAVAVLQHVLDLSGSVKEMARVTRPGGRVLAVEPDNSARHWYCSEPAGAAAYEARNHFFAAVRRATLAMPDDSVGPQMPALFSASGIEPVEVRLFPVSSVHLSPPPDEVWISRRAAAEAVVARAASPDVTQAGRDYLAALAAYEQTARTVTGAFVEIQHTMLFATVGQRES